VCFPLRRALDDPLGPQDPQLPRDRRQSDPKRSSSFSTSDVVGDSEERRGGENAS
jgi:hypothetical protein